jgi:hypothetical protein
MLWYPFHSVGDLPRHSPDLRVSTKTCCCYWHHVLHLVTQDGVRTGGHYQSHFGWLDCHALGWIDLSEGIFWSQVDTLPGEHQRAVVTRVRHESPLSRMHAACYCLSWLRSQKVAATDVAFVCVFRKFVLAAMLTCQGDCSCLRHSGVTTILVEWPRASCLLSSPGGPEVFGIKEVRSV